MGANMTSWAFNAASRFVEQERMRSEKWAQALQRHQTLVAQAPVLWESTRLALQAQVRTFNEQVGRQVLIATTAAGEKVAVLAKTETGPRTIMVEFDAKRCWITCSARAAEDTPGFEERFHLALNEEAKASLALPTGAECSAEEAAGHMLNELMGWDRATT